LAARTSVVRAVAPRHGGLDTILGVDVAWTGENQYDGSVVAPTVIGSYRLIDQTKPGRLKTSVCSLCLMAISYN